MGGHYRQWRMGHATAYTGGGSADIEMSRRRCHLTRRSHRTLPLGSAGTAGWVLKSNQQVPATRGIAIVRHPLVLLVLLVDLHLHLHLLLLLLLHPHLHPHLRPHLHHLLLVHHHYLSLLVIYDHFLPAPLAAAAVHIAVRTADL